MARSGAAHGVDAGADHAQGVDIEAGIGLIQDGELRFEHGHLEDLVALLLAAGEAGVDRAIEQGLIHLHDLHLVADQIQEVHGVEFVDAAVLADGVERRLEEVHVADAGDLDRVLEGEEDAFARPILGGHFEQVLAVVGDASAGDLVKFAAGEHLGQRALAAAVGPHDGMDFTGVHGEVDAFQNFTIANFGVQIFDFE